jgi:hypothetical protein
MGLGVVVVLILGIIVVFTLEMIGEGGEQDD